MYTIYIYVYYIYIVYIYIYVYLYSKVGEILMDRYGQQLDGMIRGISHPPVVVFTTEHWGPICGDSSWVGNNQYIDKAATLGFGTIK